MAVVTKAPESLAELPTVNVNIAQGWGAANGKWIKSILDKHEAWLAEAGVAEYQALYDGYIEEVDARDKNRGDGINNKLMVNYAQLVIDTVVDYVLGKAVNWTVEDPDEKAEKALVEEYRKEILKILKSDTTRRVLVEQLRQGCIAGYSAIISWLEGEVGKRVIDFEEFPVQEIIPVYDTRGRLIMVLRKYQDEVEVGGEIETRTRVEVYDEKYLTFYISDDLGENFELDEREIATGNPVEHGAGRIPVSVFVNGTPASYEKRLNRNGVSDLGNGVLTALKDYAHKMSDKANLAEYLMDQYLLLVGVDTDEEEVIKMRKARALVLKGDKNLSDARFISQDQDDATIENHLKRLKEVIFETTFTPLLSDLSGATATEIKIKYANLDIKAGKKEVYFLPALKHFISVITDMLNTKRLEAAGVNDIHAVLTGKAESAVALYNPEWVAVTINRNLPQNFKEIADIVAVLAGIVPDAYLYELLWFIDDPVEALKEIKAQKAEEAKRGLDALGYGGEFQNTGTGQE